ncbi:MAG: hypothetical protein NTX42_06185 [Methanothrix sp.]|nr:hypothetical protein [Methanothrix sp.]
MTFAEDMETRDKYVVWDGTNEEAYADDTTCHDCIIASDLEPISVQELRREMLKSNVVPTVVFACKMGQSAFEKPINGETRGVFSYYWNALLKHDPTVTFRDAIRQVNIFMQQEGLEQQAEVICRIDILDMPVEEVSLPNKAHVSMILDICRTNKETVMNETRAATLQAVCSLLRHPGNPWQKELQDFQARAEAGEDIIVEVIDLLSPNENVRRWMREQIAPSKAGFRGVSGYQQLPGGHSIITASHSWVCPQASCTKSLPVIQEGEDPPVCEVHQVPLIRRNS